MKQSEAKNTIHDVIDACADCDVCCYLMAENCLSLPELYRLYDQEKESCQPTDADKLRNLLLLKTC